MKLSIHRILVPVDFSEISLAALDYAAHMAKKTGAYIEVIHVLEAYEHNTGIENSAIAHDVLQLGIKEKMNQIIAANKDLEGINVKITIEEGKIHHIIHDIAERDECDLIVMGTHGSSRVGKLDKYILGSNAYRIAHGAPCSVITIREPLKEIKIRDIVLPLDVSKETKQKVSIGIDFAKLFYAKIHTISVSSYLDEFVDDKSRLRFQLEDVAKEIVSKGVECSTRTLQYENVATSIMDYCKEINADLVVIMTREEASWDDAFVGSMARRIISESTIPVLSVRPQKE